MDRGGHAVRPYRLRYRRDSSIGIIWVTIIAYGIIYGKVGLNRSE